jgi:exodeoxyribonuclease X
MKPLAAKLLRLALDPAAQSGESESAAVKLVRHWRAEGMTADALLAPGSRPARLLNDAMPFGCYKGLTLESIAAEDPGYLEWLLGNVTRLRPGLRNAIVAALERANP